MRCAMLIRELRLEIAEIEALHLNPILKMAMLGALRQDLAAAEARPEFVARVA